jgi:transposase-like protein
MKITTEPVKRVSLSIYDKGKIVLQAHSIDQNVKPTAREFNVQPKQIRKWKKEGFHDDYSSSLVPIVAVHEQTDAVRANSMEYTYLDVEDEPLVRQALRRQIELRKRKRLSSAHRKEGGGP